MQRGDLCDMRLELHHRSRKCIAQTGNELKEGQVAIADPASDEMAVALRIALKQPEEIVAYWPALIDKTVVQPCVELVDV